MHKNVYIVTHANIFPFMNLLNSIDVHSCEILAHRGNTYGHNDQARNLWFNCSL